ncbi:MAG TPA: hypothetical protein VFD52_08490 [Clostridia bacterium]|nr:hypothetical protein [Clostridia bacterium]
MIENQTDFDRKSVLLKKQEFAYRDFCNKTSRYQQKERLQVKGFGRSVSQKAVSADKTVFGSTKSAFPGEWFTKDIDVFNKNVYNPNGDVLEKLSNLSYEEAKKINPLFNDRVVRSWYRTHAETIPTQLNKSLLIEDQAVESFNLRNKYKKDARQLMLDEKSRKILDEEEPTISFSQLMANKFARKQIAGIDLYKDIIYSSSKTRAAINKKYGL